MTEAINEIVSWNCGGLSSTAAQINLYNLILSYPKTIFIISETHINNKNQYIRKLRRHLIFHSPAPKSDPWSGIAFFTIKPYRVNCDVISFNSRYIKCKITAGDIDSTILAVYGPHKKKQDFWQSLPYGKDTELIIGDLNFIESMRDSSNPKHKIENFAENWNHLNLIDADSQQTHTFIRGNTSSRLDRCYILPQIKFYFSIHYIKEHDHNPIVIRYEDEKTVEKRAKLPWRDNKEYYKIPEYKDALRKIWDSLSITPEISPGDILKEFFELNHEPRL